MLQHDTPAEALRHVGALVPGQAPEGAAASAQPPAVERAISAPA